MVAQDYHSHSWKAECHEFKDAWATYIASISSAGATWQETTSNKTCDKKRQVQWHLPVFSV